MILSIGCKSRMGGSNASNHQQVTLFPNGKMEWLPVTVAVKVICERITQQIPRQTPVLTNRIVVKRRSQFPVNMHRTLRNHISLQHSHTYQVEWRPWLYAVLGFRLLFLHSYYISTLKFIFAFSARNTFKIVSNLASVKLFSILEICAFFTHTNSPN